MINELVKLADRLDRRGDLEGADILDSIIERYSKDASNNKQNKDQKEENKNTESRA